jgi:hypothetical protein
VAAGLQLSGRGCPGIGEGGAVGRSSDAFLVVEVAHDLHDRADVGVSDESDQPGMNWAQPIDEVLDLVIDALGAPTNDLPSVTARHPMLGVPITMTSSGCMRSRLVMSSADMVVLLSAK